MFIQYLKVFQTAVICTKQPLILHLNEGLFFPLGMLKTTQNCCMHYFYISALTIFYFWISFTSEYMHIFPIITVISSTVTSGINFVVCQGRWKIVVHQFHCFLNPTRTYTCQCKHKQCEENKKKKKKMLNFKGKQCGDLLYVEHRRKNGVTFKMKGKYLPTKVKI